MKIGLFADAHYCDKETTCSGTRFPRKSFGKIKNAMEKFRGCDLVISLGDLVDDCDDTEKNIEKIKELTELIRSYGIPFVSLMGNHDYQNFTRSEFDTYTGGAYPPFSMPFGENTLVFLDANFYPDGTAYSRGNVDWKDSNLLENQLEALKKLLREDVSPDIMLCGHKHKHAFDEAGGENDALGQPCTVVVATEMDRKTRYFGGSGIVFEDDGSEVIFNDKEKIIASNKIDKSSL